MHGSILMSLERHIVEAFDEPTWHSLLSAAGLPWKRFTSLGDYPDEEVSAIVSAACAATGKDPATVLEGFGRFLAKDLVGTYGFLVKPTWTAFDLLEQTESTIHTVVRARQPGARPPVLTVARIGPEQVSIRYTSARKLCALARGIALGVGDHFGTPLRVQERTCMQGGGPWCQLDVSLAAQVLPGPRIGTEAHQQI